MCLYRLKKLLGYVAALSLVLFPSSAIAQDAILVNTKDPNEECYSSSPTANIPCERVSIIETRLINYTYDIKFDYFGSNGRLGDYSSVVYSGYYSGTTGVFNIYSYSATIGLDTPVVIPTQSGTCTVNANDSVYCRVVLAGGGSSFGSYIDTRN